jgi:hypothetical protein
MNSSLLISPTDFLYCFVATEQAVMCLHFMQFPNKVNVLFGYHHGALQVNVIDKLLLLKLYPRYLYNSDSSS